jgi:hypothetical protein
MLYCSEWLTNQHRDTYATHIGHHDQLAYFAVAQNDAVGRVRYQMLEVSPTTTRLDAFTFLMILVAMPLCVVSLHQKMLQPCGPPPAKEDDD